MAESLRDKRGATAPSDAPEQMETGLRHWYTDGGKEGAWHQPVQLSEVSVQGTSC